MFAKKRGQEMSLHSLSSSVHSRSLFLILTRGYAGGFFKHAVEVIDVLEAAFLCDLAYCEDARCEHCFCLVYAHACEIFIR